MLFDIGKTCKTSFNSMHLKDFIVGGAVEVKNAAHCELICKTGITEFFTFISSRFRTSSCDSSRRAEMLIQSQPYYAGTQ